MRYLKPMWKAVLRLLLRAAAAAAMIITLAWAGPVVWRAFAPFLVAYCVARLLQRPIAFLQKHMRGKRFPATMLCVLLSYAVLGALVYLLVNALVSQLLLAATNYQTLLGSIITTVETAANWFMSLIEYVPAAVQQALSDALNSIFAWLTEVVSRAAGNVLNSTVRFASNIPMALIFLNFLIFGTYYIAKGYPEIMARIKQATRWTEREQLNLTWGILKQGFGGYLKVQGLYGLMVLVISSLALSLYGFDLALLIALLLAVLEFLPLFGNGTLLIPWGAVCFIIGRPQEGIFLLGLHIVQIGIRRITEPKLMSGQMGISPLLSLMGMYAGMRLYGVLGLILGPIVMLVLQNLYRAHVFDGIHKDIKELAKGLRESLK